MLRSLHRETLQISTNELFPGLFLESWLWQAGRRQGFPLKAFPKGPFILEGWAAGLLSLQISAIPMPAFREHPCFWELPLLTSSAAAAHGSDPAVKPPKELKQLLISLETAHGDGFHGSQYLLRGGQTNDPRASLQNSLPTSLGAPTGTFGVFILNGRVGALRRFLSKEQKGEMGW